jgi:glycosyltransferase 2 family protein
LAALRRWSSPLLKAFLFAVTIYFVIRNVPLKASELTEFLARADLRFYASMVLFALFLMLQAGIWVQIVNASWAKREQADTSRNRLAILPGLRIFIDSQFAKYIPGGFWNYAGRIVLASKAGVPLEAQFTSIVYENVLLVSAALTYSLVLAVSLNFHPIILLLSALLLLVLTYMGYPLVTSYLKNVFTRISRWKWFGKLLGKATGSFGSSQDGNAAAGLTRNEFFGYLVCFLASHFIMGIAFWMLANSFGAGHIGLLYAAGTFATSWLLGLFSPLPGGLGVREGFLVYFLSLKLGMDAALHISVIARLWNIMAEVTFWAIIRTVSQLSKRVKAYES